MSAEPPTPPPAGKSRDELYRNWLDWVTTNLGRDKVLAVVAANAATEVAIQGSGFNAAADAARTAWAEATLRAKIAPDGSTLSADGRWRWDGTNWVAVDEMVPTGSSGTQFMQQPTGPTSVSVLKPHTNRYALAALDFGVAAYIVCPIVGAILAVTFGHIALSQINRSGDRGRRRAIAGLILGYLQLVLIIGGFLVEVALLMVPPRI